MQKLGVLLVISFLLFGIVLHSPLVVSEEGDNSGSNDNSESSDASLEADVELRVNSGDDDSDDENESEDEREEDEEKEDETEDDDSDEDNEEERFRERVKEILREGNCTIKIEREVKIEDGKRVEEIKRKMECDDGTKSEIQIKIENRTIDGRVKERIEYEFEGEEYEVETEEGVDLEEESNLTHYKLKARLRSTNGTTEIKIMPHQASEIALERLRALNFTIELREADDRNIPHVVYNIEANKSGRFLGVFKLALKVEGQVDPETGEFIGTSKPWWAFLVTGEDSDQTDDDSDDEDNETEMNETNSS